MRMGIKEFRERLGEVARGDDAVELTDRGQVIGVYKPLPKWDEQRRANALAAAEKITEWQQELRGHGVDTEDMLVAMGLDPWGVPLSRSDDR